MTTFDDSQLQTNPIFAHMITLLETLQVAKCEPIEDMGGADLESISGDTNVLVITFADKSERDAFLEAVNFPQAGPKSEAK